MIEDFLDSGEDKPKKEKKKEGVIYHFKNELNLKMEDLKLNINFSEGKSIQDIEVVFYEK